ncbi:hypothetical protein, partial [Marinobacter fuscus]|uniref:hypothetical protein n=1 Tax=Marinobacter fuscus TaxID=2109942 RepID=UPI0019817BA2
IPKGPEVSPPGLCRFRPSVLLRLFRGYDKAAATFHREFWKSADFRRAKFSAGTPIKGLE